MRETFSVSFLAVTTTWKKYFNFLCFCTKNKTNDEKKSPKYESKLINGDRFC